MPPPLKFHSDVDVLKRSSPVRGTIRASSDADETCGIGLTTSAPVNRKPVHWAAKRFDWPGYSAAEFFERNKILDEVDMPPLWRFSSPAPARAAAQAGITTSQGFR